MALPKITSPIFELDLPSTGEKIQYKPFTVKEEKILLIAQETKDVDQALLAMKQVVNNSLVNKSIDEIAMFDLEYIILTLRAKSVDNNVTFSIKDPDTEELVKLEFDLENVKMVTPENHSKEIKVNDTYTLIMRYPTINEFMELVKNNKDPETTYNIMVACMDMLVSEEDVHKFSEYTIEERNAFADDIEGGIVTKIKSFFDTSPRVRHEIKYTNNTGKEQTFVVEGMETFFI